MKASWISLLALFLLPIAAVADHVPGHAKLEWGLGIGVLAHPDFRGSRHDQQRVLPVPYIKYRGDRLRIDDGIEGRIFSTPNLLLSVSGNGSLPSSSGNSEREGMDELDATAEFGPSLEYRMAHSDTSSVWLELPLRFALNVQEDLDSIGQVFHPRVAWRRPPPNKYAWKLNLSAGLLFADERYHGYYYDVAPHEATETRPVYAAGSGYSGARIDFSYSRRIERIWVGGFVRYDNISGAAFEDSPLVSQTDNWMAGLGIAWVLSEH